MLLVFWVVLLCCIPEVPQRVQNALLKATDLRLIARKHGQANEHATT